MLYRSVKLSSVEEIHELVKKCSRLEYEIDLCSERFTVDAKSILGVFSLDLSRNLNLKLYTEDEGSVSRLLEGFAV